MPEVGASRFVGKTIAGVRIRERIDSTKCWVPSRKLPGTTRPVRGYLLLENGRTIPIKILLSGITTGGLFFAEDVAPD